MYPVSARFLRALRDPLNPLVDVSYRTGPTGPWQPARLVSGTATCDRTAQTRWASSLVLAPDTPTELGGVTPYGTRLRIRVGIRGPRWSEPEWVGLGVHRVSTAERASDGQVSVAAASLERQVARATFLVPRAFGGPLGGSARTIVEQLIREAVPDASFDWRVNGDVPVPLIHATKDRWAVIDGGTDDPSIARALGAEIYCDGDGVFVIAPTPSLDDAPVWTVRAGTALVAVSTGLSDDDVANVVVATGESTDSDAAPAGPGIAWDSDPHSPTYAGPDPLRRPDLAGPYGIVVKEYSSPLLTTTGACQAAARSQLADMLGLRKTVAFDAIANPALVAGDVVLVEVPGSGPGDGRGNPPPGVVEAHLLDTVPIELGAPAMSCTTRASATRLLGVGDLQVPDDPETSSAA